MGKFLEEPEDVHRFQELDSGDEHNGAYLDQGYNMVSNISNGKQPFNPDELYFNDMDIRAWERRAAGQAGLAYGEDYGYGYMEDEGYYEDPGEMVYAAEYEELLFQRTLDKIRLARATGAADVALTPDELEAYQNRLWRQRAPAGRPQIRARPLSDPVIHDGPDTAAVTSSRNTGASGPSSAQKKHQRRTSLFGSKSKKEKPNNRARATSNATEATLQYAPGFRVPGPNGQPVFMPINARQGHGGRETHARPPGSPLRPGSRHSSSGNERHLPTKGANVGGPKGTRQAQAPPRLNTSRDVPGAFPDSPTTRSGSSSSRLSDQADIQGSSNGRSRPSTAQQPPKLIPFPVAEYKHHNAEPFQYQAAGHLAQPSAQPQYARRVVPEPYTTMPRRVPVPVQHVTASGQSVQSSHSDPNTTHRGMADVSENGDPRARVPSEDSGSMDHGKQSSGGKDGERRRRRSRRKN